MRKTVMLVYIGWMGRKENERVNAIHSNTDGLQWYDIQ